MSYNSNTSSLLNHRSIFLLLIFLLLGAVIIAIIMIFGSGDEHLISVDDNEIILRGKYDTVADILEAAKVSYRPEDLIIPVLESATIQGSTITVKRARPITLRQGDDVRNLWTLQPTLATFLSEAGTTVDRTDQILADGRLFSFQSLSTVPIPEKVEILRSLDVIIRDGQDEISLHTEAKTVGQALTEAGIVLNAADTVNPLQGNWLSQDLEIEIVRAEPITILVDGQIIQTHSHHSNALDILAETGIGLSGLDYAMPDQGTPLQPGDTIEVIRVSEEFQVQDETIPFDSVLVASDELELDQKAMLSQGASGLERIRTRIRYENGVEVGQSPAGAWISRPANDEVIGYGTKIIIRSLDTPGGPIEYWRVVKMRATSYTAASAGKPQDHPAYGITASGVPAGSGVVAIDPNIVPFRSNVYVAGYGIGFAGDTGGGVKGRIIDFGYDEGELVSWRGYVDVYFLTPVPPADEINYLIPASIP